MRQNPARPLVVSHGFVFSALVVHHFESRPRIRVSMLSNHQQRLHHRSVLMGLFFDRRAVIFRLGRLVKGGAKGPGLFIVLPCIESYTKVDMRTVSFDVPPQEVLTKGESSTGLVYHLSTWNLSSYFHVFVRGE